MAPIAIAKYSNEPVVVLVKIKITIRDKILAMVFKAPVIDVF